MSENDIAISVGTTQATRGCYRDNVQGMFNIHYVRLHLSIHVSMKGDLNIILMPILLRGPEIWRWRSTANNLI